MSTDLVAAGRSALPPDREWSETLRVFIRYFIEIPRPKREVEVELLRSPERWLSGPARDAEERCEQLLAEVGFGPPGARIAKRVEIRFGEPLAYPSKTVLPISWKP